MMHKYFIKSILYFIGFFLIAFALWTSKYFGRVSLDQALSTFIFNLHGLLAANTSLTKYFIVWCVFWPVVLTLLITNSSLAKYYYKVLPKTLMDHAFWCYFNLFLIGTGLILVNYQYKIIEGITHRYKYHGDFFAGRYVNPHKVNIDAKKPKSLVLIYVESLETTYSNTGLFHKDLLQRLTQIKVNNISFSHYQEVPGTSWSIAGIIATQCAVPLKLHAKMKEDDWGLEVRHVLPSAQCLGDILAEKGYKNIYMNGSRLSFSGFDRFFKDHHYSELYGREKWLRSGILNKENMTFWGLPDDMLLVMAKIRLAQLVKSHEPFNLTLFMIDTHGVTGQLSQTCAKAGYNDFAGIIECTANQVADFVYYVKKQGWLEQMNIVIVGDHLAMKNLVSDKLASVKERYVFNMIVSANQLYKNTEEVVAFDLLPTILTSLGFQLQGTRLGLGYTAIGRENKSRPKGRLDLLMNNLAYDSEIYNQLWHR